MQVEVGGTALSEVPGLIIWCPSPQDDDIFGGEIYDDTPLDFEPDEENEEQPASKEEAAAKARHKLFSLPLGVTA